jgi:hypothetical protein
MRTQPRNVIDGAASFVEDTVAMGEPLPDLSLKACSCSNLGGTPIKQGRGNWSGTGMLASATVLFDYRRTPLENVTVGFFSANPDTILSPFPDFLVSDL